MTFELHEAVTDLARWEGFTTWLYLDTRGLVTVGIGNLLRDVQACRALPWQVDGRQAATAEVDAAWTAVRAQQPARAASSYASATRIRLTQGEVLALAERRLTGEFLPGLRRLYPGWDTFPAPAQRALLDMAWNLGLGGLAKFRHLAGAVSARDWAAAARSCGRITSRPERNEFTRQLFRDAAMPGNDDPTQPVRVA